MDLFSLVSSSSSLVSRQCITPTMNGYLISVDLGFSGVGVRHYFARLLASIQVGEARKDWNKRGVDVTAAFTVTCKSS